MNDRKELTRRIKEDYGTVKRFCSLSGIKFSTYNVVLSGHGKSPKVTDALIKAGYIQSQQQLNMLVW